MISPHSSDIKIISAETPWWRIDFRSIGHKRELIWMFIQRQFTLRYKQMALGVLWSVLEPLFQLVVISIIFGLVLKAKSNGYPYPIYAFAALTPWAFFTKGVSSTAASLLENMTVISKVQFPRLILPIAAILREGLESMLNFFLLLVVAAFFGFYPSLRLLAAPVLIMYTLFVAAAVGLPLACFIVKFRDVRNLITVLLQVWMYGTPIMYSASMVPEAFLPFYKLNPMYWTVEGFRWMLLGQPLTLTYQFFVSTAAVGVLLVLGVYMFAFFERTTVDVQ